MNWLDSSSFSGLLSQAQKSIDKVLDIPGEGDGRSKKGDDSLDTGKLLFLFTKWLKALVLFYVVFINYQ